MAKTSTVAPAQSRALGRIAEFAESRGLYLVGGTALAFYLGHRTSADLDLFGLERDVDFAAFKRLARKHTDVRVVRETDAVLKLRIGSVPVDIVRYPYPPLEKPKPGIAGFPVASLRDIAAMKLSAISTRGIRRDFWDLDEILKSSLSLKDALLAYRKRFKRAESDLYHVIRSLTFFDDAEKDPRLPVGLTGAHWEAIKKNMAAESVRALKLFAGRR